MRFSQLLLLVATSTAADCGGSTPPPAREPEPTPPAPVPETPVAPAASNTPAAAGAGGESGDNGGCPTGMVAIDSGTLWMGSIKGKGRPDEHPQHQVEVHNFCIDKDEVSVAAYKKCVDNEICDPLPKDVQLLKALKPEKHDKLSKLCTGGMKNADDLPANCVERDAAQKYCDWKGLRLPTEEEWEFAATGGEDKLDYPWGSAKPSDDLLCWKKKDGPCKVGAKKPGAFGLDDMEGNVREWTSSTYGAYPSPPDTGDKLVVRGASWRTKKADDVRPQRRWAESPLYRDTDLGFRCAKDR